MFTCSYGIVKIVATSIFVAVGIEKFGRSKSLGYGGAFMSMFLWVGYKVFLDILLESAYSFLHSKIIAAIFLTHIPDPNATSASPASIAMAAMIYCFVIPYCFSWGPGKAWFVQILQIRVLIGKICPSTLGLLLGNFSSESSSLRNGYRECYLMDFQVSFTDSHYM